MSAGEEDKASEDSSDPQVQPEQPGEDSSKKGRYNLHSDRSQSYNHRYAGNDFVVDDESGIVMTTEGTDEVLETPQMP